MIHFVITIVLRALDMILVINFIVNISEKVNALKTKIILL